MRKKFWFLPCTDYREIPVEYVKQVKGLRWSYEKFEVMQEQGRGHPCNLLYKLIDKKDPDQKIQGFLWAMMDPLSDSIVVQVLSVDKKLQGAGKIIPITRKFLEYIQREGKFKNVYWLADRHRAYKKYGGRYSKYSLMCLLED